jgi:hypothetical protein
LSSLRTWNQNIIDNQLGECVAEICWKTWHNNKLGIFVE